MAEHRTVCRACTAQCGLIVSVDDGRISRIRGDVDHPASDGYSCIKGRSLAALHSGSDRLRGPRLRGAVVGWDECLDDLALAVARVRDTHGAEALGIYSSMGAAFESAGLFLQNRFVSELGVDQRYSALMYDCGPLLRAAQMIGGLAWELNPSWVPEQDEPCLVLFVGCNPVVSHGYQTNLPRPRGRMRAFQRRGGEIWVIDVRNTETADLADRALIIRPGSDAYVLAWLLAQLLTEGYDAGELARFCAPGEVHKLREALSGFDIGLATARSGLSTRDLEDLIAAVRRSGRIAILTGTGVQFSPNALVTEWLRLAIGVVTGSIDHDDGMWVPPGWVAPFERRPSQSYGSAEGEDEPGPAARPDLRQLLGEYPAVAMADQIDRSYLRGLFVAGGSPLTAGPQPDRLRRLLGSLDFLAVTDVIENELTHLATHVLPVSAMFERSDVVKNKSRICYAPAVLAAPNGTRPAWWVWAQLAMRLGADLLDGLAPDDCSDETINRILLSDSRDGADALFGAGPHGLPMPHLHGWFHDVLPDGRWRLAPTEILSRLVGLQSAPAPGGDLVFVSGRVMGASNSVRYACAPRLGHPEGLRIHPEDAAARCISDGTRLVVESSNGSLVTAAVLDERVEPGTASLTHGLPASNAAALVDPNVDPLTGQPVFSGFAVRVTKASTAE
jgi:anaerobic selenocysteine-containing dehydrogenase